MENNHNTSTKRFKRKQNNDYTEQEHKMWVEVLKENDPYYVLGVSRNGNKDDIKSAYK